MDYREILLTDDGMHAVEKAAAELSEDYARKMEFYLRAWIAETGLNPSECELVVEHTATGTRAYARKREAYQKE